jgi:hypothetical protein
VRKFAPLILICIAGFGFTLAIAWPGWMSADSMVQYSQAKADAYADWHPPFMAWWWSKSLLLVDGPQSLFIQLQALYWLGWGLLAAALRPQLGRWHLAVPLVGLWPGLLFPAGMIWKDIWFAVFLLPAWGLMLLKRSQGERLRWWQTAIVFLLAAFAVAAKPNGTVVLPFLFAYWVYVQGLWGRSWQRRSAVALTLVVAIVGAIALPAVMMRGTTVARESNFQYQQTHDLFGIGVRAHQMLFPEYITAKVGTSIDELAPHYGANANNWLFGRAGGGLRTEDRDDLKSLRDAWILAIVDHPVEYLDHRIAVFASLLGLGQPRIAYVAMPYIVPNPFGLEFTPNPGSDLLDASLELTPWFYYPWLYALLLLALGTILLVVRKRTAEVIAIGGSAVAFVAPHLLIVPSSDYRYLYYAYICSVVLTLLAPAELMASRRRVPRPEPSANGTNANGAR